jgi:hypothetical protein
VVGLTTGSRGKVPGKRKPVIREQHDDGDDTTTTTTNNNNNNNNDRNSENVEHEMLCHTSIHWGHRNFKQKFTKISGNNTRTTLNRFLTKNCHTRNITQHKESATS